MKLNLFAGAYPLDGFTNLDKASGWKAEDGLPYEDESVEGLTEAHGLMFVAIEGWPALFAECYRVLEPGGVFRVTEDSTDDPASERFGGFPGAVTLTTAQIVLSMMATAGFEAQIVRANFSADPSLIQDNHGGEPKCIFVEGIKRGGEVAKRTKPRKRKEQQPVRISVIVPTIGRDSLGRALRSAKDADEVLVEYNNDGDRGYQARERAQARAKGTHLVYLDCDDQYLPGAIGLFRDAATQSPKRVSIFRMRYAQGNELWRVEEVVFGNIGSPMLCVPNIPDKLGRWKAHHGSDTGGDYTFAAGCCDNLGPAVFRPEVVCLIRPN